MTFVCVCDCKAAHIHGWDHDNFGAQHLAKLFQAVPVILFCEIFEDLFVQALKQSLDHGGSSSIADRTRHHRCAKCASIVHVVMQPE